MKSPTHLHRALLLWPALIAAAGAASLHISPVTLEMTSSQSAVGLTLSNPGERALTAQVRLFAWNQSGGTDQLLAQQTLVVSPPIVRIAPGETQLVRVVRPASAAGAPEQAYRLLIDEIPEPADAVNEGTVDIRLRYSVPRFLRDSATPLSPRLHWSLRRHDGLLFLGAWNEGRTRAQLSTVRLLLPDGSSRSVAEGLLGYALAGAGREWPLPATIDLGAGRDLRVQALVNREPVEAPVRLAVDAAPP